MVTDCELLLYQKATVYDILLLLQRDGRQSYTAKEVQELLNAYADRLEQK